MFPDLTKYQAGVKTCRESSWDRTGGNADFRFISPGQTLVLADLRGPGCIRHIWLTLGTEDKTYLRSCVLRMFWDEESEPSVEVPLGDFFGLGHGIMRPYSCLMLNTTAGKSNYGDLSAMNCYFPMPFSKRAVISIENQGKLPIQSCYYYIDYDSYIYDAELPKNILRFHSQWRRENPCQGIHDKLAGRGINYWWHLLNVKNPDWKENYVILEAEGQGHYVGCNLSVDNIDPTPDGLTWWGEGDDMIIIDDEPWPPRLHGTGSEDYFCQAWGMQDVAGFFAGVSIPEKDPSFPGRHKTTVYRQHILDPIVFHKSILVTIEHGHANLQNNDYASTAYWYQREPHKLFPELLPREKRLPSKEDKCVI